MSSILGLRQYGAGSDTSSDEDTNYSDVPNSINELTLHLQPIESGELTANSLKMDVAPAVTSLNELDENRYIDPNDKELKFNPKFEELYAPVLGPKQPTSKYHDIKRNILSGHVEEAHINDFNFEVQRRTFYSYGYAIDPSVSNEKYKYVGDTDEAEKSDGITIFETKLKDDRPKKRKVDSNKKPEDIDGFKGPWAKYIDEQTVMKPSEEEQLKLDEITSKRSRKGKQSEDKPIEEKSLLHIKDAYDYQGRPFTHIPKDADVNLKSTSPPEKCFVPKKLIHTWKGHNKGVSAIKWFPLSGHLLLSCSMDMKIKIWEVYGQRRCVRTYMGHQQAVRDACFNNEGNEFLSAGYDRYIKLWDTETGDCKSRFTSKKIPYCVKFHPDEDKQNLFVAGTSDKKIVCWDTRTGEIVQEYDRHLGAVNTITFIDENRRFVSTSDDKSLRVWEWDIPVDFKYLADPTMHSMPAVALSPNKKWLACQSMDNKVTIFAALDRFKMNRKKVFTGHMVAGYACGLDFSPEMSYLVSGDADGKAYVWDWRTTKLIQKWKAHDEVCSDVLWHPHETSKVATASWDGLIKYWD